MPESEGVWAIDIGQAGLKALRLRYAEAAQQVLAVAFDYVPHPKLLSQPDAIPEELIPQALETFLSRNDIGNDKVAVSVPGPSTLVKFIQLPPVESSKVADIVRYEARQQIPFDLDDVIWDYQPLGGAVEDNGYMLEAEVGLFAMKRTDVERSLKPFLDQKIEVELVQAAPLGLFNVLCYDQLGIRPGQSFEPSDEYTILLDMGADNTTLIVSNGEKIWMRNVPIGGNHFTRALTKEMKLTFAKAEHLKCNATRSPDPRAVFQALRPVFNNYVAEIQRSIGFFSSVNRDARIGKILGLGNGFKLAGLQKFLQQNLNYEVQRLDQFEAVVGDAVLGAPLFEDNILSFAVPYGIALQTLGLTNIRTSLLPPEIAVARKIRRKKPWAVVAAASLLTGLAISAGVHARAARSVSEDRWADTESKSQTYITEVSSKKQAYDSEVSRSNTIHSTGEKLIRNPKKRDLVLRMHKTIAACLPRDVGNAAEDNDDIMKRNRINIVRCTQQRVGDLGAWFNAFPESAQRAFALEEDRENPPEGAGYVYRIEGEHFHHNKEEKDGVGIRYVQKTLLANLKKNQVKVPDSNELVPVREFGITHPIISEYTSQKPITYDPNANRTEQFLDSTEGLDESEFGDESEAGLPEFRTESPLRGRDLLPSEDTVADTRIEIYRTTFTIEFAWRPNWNPEGQDGESPQ